MVNPSLFVLIPLVFVTGLTTTGTAATLFELAARRRLGFVEPFISVHHPWRSLVVGVTAGPFMLVNDALEGFRLGAISPLYFWLCCLAGASWAFSAGIIAVALAATGLSFLS